MYKPVARSHGIEQELFSRDVPVVKDIAMLSFSSSARVPDQLLMSEKFNKPGAFAIPMGKLVLLALYQSYKTGLGMTL